ncbi:hypothetical protein K7A41_02710 [Sphingobacterium sp. InxBP1]|nr:hypothetical protein [Sphingobacterium sp. InxBP1]
MSKNKIMSNANLSLIATGAHIVMAIVLFSYQEKLYVYDLEGAVITLLFVLVILALALAINSRKTTLGLLLLFLNALYLPVCLLLLYIGLTFTFRV